MLGGHGNKGKHLTWHGTLLRRQELGRLGVLVTQINDIFSLQCGSVAGQTAPAHFLRLVSKLHIYFAP